MYHKMSPQLSFLNVFSISKSEDFILKDFEVPVNIKGQHWFKRDI